MILRIDEGCYLLEAFDEIENKINYEQVNYSEYEFRQCTNHVFNIINCFLPTDGGVGDMSEAKFLEKDYRVLSCIIEDNFHRMDSYEKKFKKIIEERTVCINREWAFSYEEPSSGVPNIRWFEAYNVEDIKYLIERDIELTLVIVHANNDIKNSEYILNIDEFGDFNVLNISEKEKGKFLEVVLPKLLELLDYKIEIIDER